MTLKMEPLKQESLRRWSSFSKSPVNTSCQKHQKGRKRARRMRRSCDIKRPNKNSSEEQLETMEEEINSTMFYSYSSSLTYYSNKNLVQPNNSFHEPMYFSRSLSCSSSKMDLGEPNITNSTSLFTQLLEQSENRNKGDAACFKSVPRDSMKHQKHSTIADSKQKDKSVEESTLGTNVVNSNQLGINKRRPSEDSSHEKTTKDKASEFPNLKEGAQVGTGQTEVDVGPMDSDAPFTQLLEQSENRNKGDAACFKSVPRDSMKHQKHSTIADSKQNDKSVKESNQATNVVNSNQLEINKHRPSEDSSHEKTTKDKASEFPNLKEGAQVGTGQTEINVGPMDSDCVERSNESLPRDSMKHQNHSTIADSKQNDKSVKESNQATNVVNSNQLEINKHRPSEDSSHEKTTKDKASEFPNLKESVQVGTGQTEINVGPGMDDIHNKSESDMKCSVEGDSCSIEDTKIPDLDELYSAGNTSVLENNSNGNNNRYFYGSMYCLFFCCSTLILAYAVISFPSWIIK
ncbi:hypothetical protein ACOME3_001070 [Neoechinorhynchus agilis]